MASPRTTALVDQSAAYVRDYCDAASLDLDNPALANAVKIVVVQFMEMYLNVAKRQDPQLGMEVWALNCTAWSEALGA